MCDRINRKKQTIYIICVQLKSTKKSYTSEMKKAEKLKEKLDKIEKSLEETKQEKILSEEASAALQAQLLEDHANFRIQTDEKYNKLVLEKVLLAHLKIWV